ncbi:MAG: RNA polymerase sigma factor, partial [Blastocatellia bacterium]
VINVCRDIRRKRPLSTTSYESEREIGSLDSLASSDDVEATAIESQQRRIVAQALDSLTKREKEALVLRDLEGLSTEEVARILGSSESTVRSQISSARGKIKTFKDRLLKKQRR